MSVSLMSQAFKAKLPSSPKFVLVALCDHANDMGECFPSTSMLAEKCSISARHVFSCLDELERGGLLPAKPEPDAAPFTR